MSRLVVVFVLSLFLITPYVRGDGNGYYAYVRSVILDGDLNFENEYARADPKFRENLFKRRITPRGYLDNPWAPGSAVLWAPFFLAGHAIATAGNALGLAVPLDGFSPPYRWAVAVGTATFADPLAPIKVLEGLAAYVRASGLGSIRDIVGAAQPARDQETAPPGSETEYTE